MKPGVIIANLVAGALTAAGFAAHARHQNRSALANAAGLCASAVFRSRLEHLAEPANFSPVPCRIHGEDLRYTFRGFGSYSASCVVTRSDGLVLAASVVETP
ncbi:MAG: hypothetical protein NVS9B10_11760 [Nevskia sp.]